MHIGDCIIKKIVMRWFDVESLKYNNYDFFADENEIATHPHRHKHGEKDSPTVEPRTILPLEGSGTIPFEIRFPPPPRIPPPPPPIFRHKTESWIRDSMYNKMMAQVK